MAGPITEMYPVPAGYKAHLQEADFACMHIAEKGTEVSVGNVALDGKQFAVCAECHIHLQKKPTKAAKAGK